MRGKRGRRRRPGTAGEHGTPPAGQERGSPPRSAPRRSWWLLLPAITGIVSAAYLVSAWVTLSGQPLPASLAAGRARLVYDTRPVSLVSPVCGCQADDSATWRGITFLSRRFEITASSGGDTSTSFTAFASFPGPFSYYPDPFMVRVEEFEVALPGEGEGDPLTSDLAFPASARVTRLPPERTGSPSLYTLVSKGRLTVASRSPISLAAWIPLRSSTIELASQPLVRDPDTTEFSLVERYGPNPYPGETEPDAPDFEGGYPSVDVLGPVIWVWTPRERAGFGPGQATRFLVVRLEVPYSLRIVVQPDGTGPRAAVLYQPRTAAGTVALHFRRSPKERAAYQTVNAGMATKLAPAVPLDADGSHPSSKYQMSMASPPALAGDGFNVFGSLGSLSLDHAEGSVMIGANRWDLRNASLTMTQIAGFHRSSPGNALALHLAGEQVQSRSEFEATGTIAINGDTITTPQIRWRHVLRQMDLSLLLCSLGTALTALIGWIWQRTGPRRPPSSR